MAVLSCYAYADGETKVADDVRDLFTGVPPAKRGDVRAAFYLAIREADGLAGGKVKSVKALSDRARKAYDAARQAYSRLFPGKKKGGKKKAGRVASAIRSRADVGPSVEYWKQQEGVPGVDIPRVLAAFEALGALLPAKAKK
jgi:hypothetical protein